MHIPRTVFLKSQLWEYNSELVESPSLEVFRRCSDLELSDMVYWRTG